MFVLEIYYPNPASPSVCKRVHDDYGDYFLDGVNLFDYKHTKNVNKAFLTFNLFRVPVIRKYIKNFLNIT